MRKPQPTDSAPPVEAPATAPLSRFEGHCLCRRTRECEELLQLALLGVESAQARHSPDHDLTEIAGHLAEAERHAASGQLEVERLMATRSIKPVTRESSALVRERGLRAVVVTIVGSVIELRAKGLRSRETVDVAWCYYAAVKQRVAMERAERANKSKGKRRR